LQRLQQALAQVKSKTKWVFLGLPSDGYCAIQQELASQLGAANIECWPMLNFEEYRAQLQGCHLAVDTYPFGGFITIIDLLWLRKPVLCLAGERTYNRNAAYLQRQLGLEALVTHSGADFVQQLVRLIDDGAYRQSLVTQLLQADLNPLFDNSQASAAFVTAIDYVLNNHSRLQQQASKSPLIIHADLTVESASA
jgi:predicted O-linked N-acetylglucosamine transferase (SPINDLY family)